MTSRSLSVLGALGLLLAVAAPATASAASERPQSPASAPVAATLPPVTPWSPDGIGRGRLDLQAGLYEPEPLASASIPHFTVPDVSCGDLKDVLTGVIVGLGDVVVPIAPTYLGGVQLGCVVLQPYYVLQATVPSGVCDKRSRDVRPGDEIGVTAEQRGDSVTVTTTNRTTGTSVTCTGPAFSQGTTYGAFPLFAVDTLGLLAVPDFGEIALHEPTVNKDALKVDRWTQPGIVTKVIASREDWRTSAAPDSMLQVLLQRVVHCCVSSPKSELRVGQR